MVDPGKVDGANDRSPVIWSESRKDEISTQIWTTDVLKCYSDASDMIQLEKRH